MFETHSKNKEFRLASVAITAATLLLVSSLNSFAANSNSDQNATDVKQTNQNSGGKGNSDLAKDEVNKINSGKSDLEHGKSNQGNNGKSDQNVLADGSNANANGQDKSVPLVQEKRNVAVNVVLKTSISQATINVLSNFGHVTSVVESINALTMRTSRGEIQKILALGFVQSLNEDAVRNAIPLEVQEVNSVQATSTALGTWNLDMVNVTEGVDADAARVVDQTGAGTYVAVIDTGLLKTWRNYFDSSNIAVNYGIAFGGGGGEMGTVSQQPNKWELDQDSHGTHVTSTIVGYRFSKNRYVTGVAPGATVIPVKVLNQNGSGWSSVVAAGITYVGDLKKGPLKNHPVVINMSLGGPTLDSMEKAAIDYAIAQGVIVVASAGNSGTKGMGYPGAYAPVISVAAAGWVGEWGAVEDPSTQSWWRSLDVSESDPTNAYITTFSSRELEGQQLDVAAPGSLILGPYQTNGQLSWYFLGGTSMASPHVAGIAALMLEKNGSLNQGSIESKLKNSATPFTTTSAQVLSYDGISRTITWGSDATGSGLVNAVSALASVTP